MKYLFSVSLFLLIFSCFFALADNAVVPVEASNAKAVTVLQSVEHAIPLSLPAGILLAVSFLGELLVRLVPSSKPRSLLLVVSAVLNLVSSIFSKASALLDQVVQNVKDPVK